VLFYICNHNKIRSRTGKRIYSSAVEYQARSASTAENAKVRLTS